MAKYCVVKQVCNGGGEIRSVIHSSEIDGQNDSDEICSCLIEKMKRIGQGNNSKGNSCSRTKSCVFAYFLSETAKGNSLQIASDSRLLPHPI